MKLLKSIIRPDKLEQVKDALALVNVTGMTVTEVRGHGAPEGPEGCVSGNGIQRHSTSKGHARVGSTR